MFVKVRGELESLPRNEDLTRTLCDPGRFSGILVMDGKYVKVRGYEQKIPFVYGIDYETHDIPFGGLFASEDETSFSLFFERLRQTNYPLRAVVADDRGGLKNALLKAFPLRPLQLCQGHYLENIRRTLNVRSEERYRAFFNDLVRRVFRRARTESEVISALQYLWMRQAKRSETLTDIILGIRDRRDELFYCLKKEDFPNTTNIIESYNSHLEGRLKTVKGFKSFQSAALWLNASLIRRRTKKLTDCKGKFKPLNGHASLELTIQKKTQWPDVLTKLGVSETPYFDAKKALKR